MKVERIVCLFNIIRLFFNESFFIGWNKNFGMGDWVRNRLESMY